MGNIFVDLNSANKKKVVFILGSTGSGKTKLSVDLATHFKAEIINSDKLQVYKGLDVVTNKATESERRGVPHHLLGVIQDPDTRFTVGDFARHVESAIDDIIGREHLPIIAGGSNSYIEALVEDPKYEFKKKYECCFIWIYVAMPVLFKHVSKRVDQMVEAGLVEELREMFVSGADYGRGIRRAIGAPEMDAYYRAERNMEDDETLKSLLKYGIEKTKENTCNLAARQTQKILRLRDEVGWQIHQLEATPVFKRSGESAEALWEVLVLEPSLTIVADFLRGERPMEN